MSSPYHTDCWGLVKFLFHLFGFGTVGGVVGVAGITIIEALFILLWSGQLSSIPLGLLTNSYIYQLVLDNKTSWRYKALKLIQDSFLVSVSSRWSLGLLGVRYRVSVPVSLTLKNETGLGIGIVHSKKSRSDSVSVSLTLRKRDQTRYRYHSLKKTRPDSVSVSLKNGLGEKFTAKLIMKASY